MGEQGEEVAGLPSQAYPRGYKVTGEEVAVSPGLKVSREGGMTRGL